MGPDSRFLRTDRVVHRELKEGAVLLNLDDGSYFQVNPVGLIVWESFDDNDLVGIIDIVRSKFSEAPPSVEADVTAFVEALLDRGLISGNTDG